jgi:1-acyl-sn-glycerol-3-phosphate acyltransferase
VVPIRIHGLFEVKKSGRRFARPGEIRINIGAPLKFESGEDPQAIAEQLQRIVDQL